MDLVQLFSATGLAAGAGQRAALVALALGAFHHTEYFELAPRFAWLASTPVLVALGVVALADLVAERFPEIAELRDLAGYLPAAVVGFIASAGALGAVDQNLVALGASGVLGSAVAVGTHYGQVRVREQAREMDDSVDRLAGWGASLGAGGLTTASIFQPWLVLPVLALLVLAVVVLLFTVHRLKRALTKAGGFHSVDGRDDSHG